MLTSLDVGAQTRPEATAYLDFPTSFPQPKEWRYVDAFPKLPNLPEVIAVVTCPDGKDLLAISRLGRVIRFTQDPEVEEVLEFLDIRHKTAGYSDSGLISVVFHPEHGQANSPNRGYIYVWYAYHPDPASIDTAYTVTSNRLSRFTVPDGESVADPDSELILIEHEDVHLYHMGGGMFFHPEDGFLYLALADEGPWEEVTNSTQTLNRDLKSGVIRIDVDQRGGDISHPIRRQPLRGITQHYYIPRDNPWVGEDVLEEFYAIGLRNPYRMTHDPVSGRSWVTDPGTNVREEVNLLEKGANYQWPFREGTALGRRPTPSPLIGNSRGPYFEYARQAGICVIGGFVYRNGKYSEFLEGKYIFADLRGVVRAFDASDETPGEVADLGWLPGGNHVAITGVDPGHDGEILISSFQRSRIFRLVPREPELDSLPALLSETGAFEDLENLVPAANWIPYDVISPLWSDGSLKSRWISLPTNTEPSVIQGGLDEVWRFPPGTVFMKHFALPEDVSGTGPVRRLETRFLIVQEDGSTYGITYRWLPDQSDAFLVTERQVEEFDRTRDSDVFKQVWEFPGTRDCAACHTPEAGFVLGFEPMQLNSLKLYPGSNEPGLQLQVLADMGCLESPLDEEALAMLPRLVNPYDDSEPIQDRVRSYLHANCSSCHLPGGVRAEFDARYTTDLLATRLFTRAGQDLGTANMRLIHPGQTEASAIFQRIQRRDESQMPPLASSIPDPAAVQLLETWIQSLPHVSVGSSESPILTSNLDWSLQLNLESSSPVTATRVLLNGREVADWQQDPTQGIIRLQPGSNTLLATATSEAGATSVSDPVEVRAEGTGPSVSWEESTLETWHPSLQLPLAIRPIDPDTPWDRVEFWVDNQWIATTTEEPHTFVHETEIPGEYSIQAIAFLADGSWNVTAPVSVRVADGPLVHVHWADHEEPVPHLDQPNLVPSMERIHIHHLWHGYFGKPPILSRTATDPFGTWQALRVGSGDFGGDDDAMSGFVVVTEDALPEQSYQVSAWVRSTGDPFSMRLGMTDLGYTIPIEVTEEWKRFEMRADFEWCYCYADFRIFQIYEALLNNPGWEMVQPSVYAFQSLDLVVDVGDLSDEVDSWELVSGENSTSVVPNPSGRITVHVPDPGYYGVAVRIRWKSGQTTQSEPLYVLTGSPPQLYWLLHPGVLPLDPVLLVNTPYAQPFVLEATTDMKLWDEVLSGITTGEWQILDQKQNENLSETDGASFRVRMLPKSIVF